jgi:acetyl esterase/lipase
MRPGLLVTFVSLMMLGADLALAQGQEEAKPERIGLWNKRAPLGDGKFQETEVWMTVHRPAKPNGTAIVICPGGGYGGLVTGAEGHGIATWLKRHGITGVVLEYRLPGGRAQVPLLDAQRSVRIVRANAKTWRLDPERIGIMGFSAGGHLASTAGTHFDAGEPDAADPVQRVSCRPDFMILVYPVITMGEKGHQGSRNNLLGKKPEAKLVDLYSNEKQVTAKTPPTFLAHAKDDRAVPPENSRLFYEALRAHKVPADYLELPSGGHGLDGYKGPMWDTWQERSLSWLVETKFVPTEARREASHGKPNLVIILADDMGYSDLGCYGGEIKSPVLDKLAQNGVRFVQFYNTPRCCPSRAALMTGLYSHQTGIGNMTADQKLPGYRGSLNDRCVTTPRFFASPDIAP